MDALSEVPPLAGPGSEIEKTASQLTHVLLIEDNPGDARLIELMVREAGHEVFSFERVERLGEGLERLSHGGIGVVLLDLSLPDSHGLETFFQLREAVPGIPIIVLSGLNDTSVAVEAVHEGAQDFLVKGQVDGQLLVRAMRYAIERKRMTEQLGRYAEELRCKNAQLEADFNMAREIQEVFLPRQYPSFPQNAPAADSALRFAHRYIPAAAVGGDFFDVFALSDTQAGVFICDVMGHGMRAALITAIMRGLIEELLSSASDPGSFLLDINRSLRAILRQTQEPFLATAVYAVVDAVQGELRFASAGHPSPIQVLRSEGRVEPLKICDPRHGPALGLFDKPDYPTCACPFVPGDLLLLFTDGLYEVDDAEQTEFGQDRLLQAVQMHVSCRGSQLLDRLLNEVKNFTHRSDFSDDVCLVTVESERLLHHPNGHRV